MIRVNLAAKKQSAMGAKDGVAMPKLEFGDVNQVLDQFRDLPIKKLGMALVAGVIATVAVGGYKEDLLKAEEAELQKLNAEKPKLQAEANKMKGLEDLQKSMAADEQVIRTKLDTIKKLSSDRTGAVKVLQELSKVTIPEVWLSSIELKDSQVTLKGSSQDFGHVTEFTKMLQNSSLFTEMLLKDTAMGADEQKRVIANFNVTVKKR